MYTQGNEGGPDNDERGPRPSAGNRHGGAILLRPQGAAGRLLRGQGALGGAVHRGEPAGLGHGAAKDCRASESGGPQAGAAGEALLGVIPPRPCVRAGPRVFETCSDLAREHAANEP